jgi:ATP-binding cassette subfamily C protein
MNVSFLQKIIGVLRPYNGVKTPTILQLSETECGVAALAILLSYYKTNVPIEKLREMCGTSRDGCKATTLMKVAKELGFNADAYRVEIDDLSSLYQPVIAFWNFNHYVVINGFGTDKVFINDPACGSTIVTMKQFDAAFTGIILVITPSHNAIKIKSIPVFFPLIRDWLRKFYIEFTFILICLLIALLCPLLNSGLSKIFFDYCVITANVTWIPYLAICGIAFAILYCLTNIQQKWAQFKLCAKASIAKSSELALHMLKLPLFFYSLRQKSEVVTILSRAEMTISLLFNSLSHFLMNSIAVLICLFFMMKINLSLFGASIILSSLSCGIFYPLAKLNLALEKINLHTDGKYHAHAMSSIRNIETIKSCGLENKILQKWRQLFSQRIVIQDKTKTLSLTIETLNRFFDSISMLTLFMMGGAQVIHGDISIGYLMAYYSLHLFYCGNLSGLLQTFKDAQTAYASHIRASHIFCYEQDNRFKNNNLTHLIKTEPPFIACNNVDFYYNKTMPATLNNINLEIKPRQHIALVGATGSGKSTLAKLLCALYPISSGKIEIDKKDIKDFSPHELAGLFAYVSQDVSLFSGTLYENLTLWKNDISVTEINRAIHAACLEELITTRTLSGKVDENGNNFSGGEKQRIDIARALIQNARILILDEATSALDIQTEMQLITNLRAMPITIIYVAHRLSTIQHCDQIWVMENGLIVEKGNHADLMKRKSQYYHLIQNEPGTHLA